jgi:hypothetical protein
MTYLRGRENHSSRTQQGLQYHHPDGIRRARRYPEPPGEWSGCPRRSHLRQHQPPSAMFLHHRWQGHGPHLAALGRLFSMPGPRRRRRGVAEAVAAGPTDTDFEHPTRGGCRRSRFPADGPMARRRLLGRCDNCVYRQSNQGTPGDLRAPCDRPSQYNPGRRTRPRRHRQPPGQGAPPPRATGLGPMPGAPLAGRLARIRAPWDAQQARGRCSHASAFQANGGAATISPCRGRPAGLSTR